MKIISWNVNGLRAVERKEEWGKFLAAYDPDIVFIQETKSQPEQVTKIDEAYPTYAQFYHSAEKKGYSGVGIWYKKDLPITDVSFHHEMKEDPFANEGRIAQLNYTQAGDDYSVLGVYFPNGGKSPEAWDGKLLFYEKFLDHVNQLRTEGKKVIFTGDVNCAHYPIDLARPKDNEGVIGFHPKERAWLDQWVEDGWVDVWRKTYPEKTDVYSWWHLITRSRARNVGWRIDYFFVDEPLMKQVKSIEYLNDQMGSDHCPVLLEV